MVVSGFSPAQVAGLSLDSTIHDWLGLESEKVENVEGRALLPGSPEEMGSDKAK